MTAACDEFSLAITQLSHDGRGMGFFAGNGALSGRGKAVFVTGALPGQIVRCKVTKNNKSYLNAVTLEVLKKADNQVSPLCSHSEICGGCSLQVLPYSEQLHWKEKLACEAMSRIGKLSSETIKNAWSSPIPAPTLKYFRNKLELAFGHDSSDKFALGFRQRGTHGVFSLHDCAIMDSGCWPIINFCERLARNTGLQPYNGEKGFWRFLTLRKARTIGDASPRWWLILLTSKADVNQRKVVRALGEQLLAAYPDLACFIHEERSSKDMLASGQKRIFHLTNIVDDAGPKMALNLKDRLFQLDASSFFQVNSSASQNLARIVMEFDKRISPKDGLLDLYCGVGAPGQLIGAGYRQLLGVEADARAVAYARLNGGDLANAHYLAMDVDSFFKTQTNKACRYSTILADPPRSGLSGTAMNGILQCSPAHILYVSCNPATMARDANILQKNYELVALQGVDMFPHTPHLECCGLWRKLSG